MGWFRGWVFTIEVRNLLRNLWARFYLEIWNPLLSRLGIATFQLGILSQMGKLFPLAMVKS
jgi:hypothetical protein